MVLLAAPQSSFAAPFNSEYLPHKTLYNLLFEHLKQKTDQKLFNTQIKIHKISKYLKLKVCKAPVQVTEQDPLKIAGRITSKLSCEQPKWKIYISSTITGDLPVIVSTHTLLKNIIIGPKDAVQKLVPYQKVRSNVMTNLSSVIGNRTKRAIGPNKILTIRMIQPPYWVFKHQLVNIKTSLGSITITTKGTALKSGVNREQIPVINNHSKKIIKGIVIAPNTVWVP